MSLDPSLKPLKVLEAISTSNNQGMGITEIAEHSNLSKTTIFRIVNALTESGYLKKDTQSKKYKLGYKILHISSSVIDNNQIKKIAHPHLMKLSAIAKETIHLVELDEMFAIYTAKIDCLYSVGLLSSRVGKRILLHSTATGKILLSDMEKEDRQKIYLEIGLERKTNYTLDTEEKIEYELEKIKQQGYALDRMENREGIFCVAAPIFNYQGKVVASCSISGPTFRFSEEKGLGLVETIKEIALDISKDLGYIPNEQMKALD